MSTSLCNSVVRATPCSLRDSLYLTGSTTTSSCDRADPPTPNPTSALLLVFHSIGKPFSNDMVSSPKTSIRTTSKKSSTRLECRCLISSQMPSIAHANKFYTIPYTSFPHHKVTQEVPRICLRTCFICNSRCLRNLAMRLRTLTLPMRICPVCSPRSANAEKKK